MNISSFNFAKVLETYQRNKQLIKGNDLRTTLDQS